MAARSRVNGQSLAPYAVATARNLMATAAQKDRRAREKAHLLAETDTSPAPELDLVAQEEASTVGRALTQLSPAERDVLLAHEVDGRDTAELAREAGTTAGAVAAQLARARAKLRVEYLLVQEGVEPPTDRCRPVLRALSLGDRRRQRELDTSTHLLGCETCAGVSTRLLERRPVQNSDEEVRVAVSNDSDVVVARQQGRAVAGRAGLSGADSTLVATAISEVARNIVKFAERGEIVVSLVSEGERTGVSVVARDVGPGISDVSRALEDGYSTYSGLGLGLPGCRRLMDDFAIVSEGGKGTMVTMTKWRAG